MNQNWKLKFFTIAVGQTVSLIGSSAVQFAIIWWLSATTGSAMMLSLAGLAAFLPQLLMGPFVGVWIDRRKRKTIVIAADLAIGVIAALFAAYFAFAGTPPVWTVCAVLGVRAIGTVFHTPALQALIPMLVPQEKLMQANGWNQFFQSGALMLGPVFGALLYSACPMPIVLLTDLVGALAAAGTMVCIHIEEPAPSGVAVPNFRSEFREGVEVYRQRPALLRLLSAAALCMLFYLPLSSLYPLMSSDYFRVDSAHASLVEAVYAAGTMLLALVIGRLKPGNHLRRSWFGLICLGVSTLVCGLMPSTYGWFWAFAVACLAMGGCASIYGLPVMTYMQEDIPPEKLGRAFSLLGTAMSAAMPLGLLLAGPCAEAWGVARWFLISGVAMVLICAIMLLTRRKTENQLGG